MLENLHTQITLRDIPQHTWLQLNLVQGGEIAGFRHAASRRAVNIIEHHPRQPSAGEPPRVIIAVDGARPSHEFRPVPLS